MKTMEFEVSGMKCSGCSSKIFNTISEMDGVVEVSVSHDDNFAKIEFEEQKIKSLEFKTKIEELGFKVLKMKKV